MQTKNQILEQIETKCTETDKTWFYAGLKRLTKAQLKDKLAILTKMREYEEERKMLINKFNISLDDLVNMAILGAAQSGDEAIRRAYNLGNYIGELVEGFEGN